jgi:outer membrane protein assembly factor BamD
MRSSITAIILSLLGVLVAGCGLFKDKPDETKNWSAQRLYTEAKDEIKSGNYEKGVKLLETLEARYPYGKYAQQAQLDQAYAYYKQDETAQAVAAAERFVKLHPNHPNVDYAYYLKGLANFREDLGLFPFLSGDDLAERDPKGAREAFDTFKELASRFPESRYTPDATKRMNYLVNALALHEVRVADYYYRRGAYLAAANRAQEAVNSYPRAPALEEALHIMMRSYEAMGLKDLAADAAKVMAQNFPKSKFLTGANDAAWWKFWQRQ